jgi:hypothetical protein
VKPIIVYNDKWLSFWGFGVKNIVGMTIFPFIILREDYKGNPPNVLICHESIHIRQQAELLLIFFAIIYYGHWLFNIIKFAIKKETDIVQKAYRNIVFEVESYENDEDLNYLNNRKIFACFRNKK